MGRARGWGSQQTGRPAMRSPGRPPVARREHRVRFWAAIARGLQTEEAAAEAGVSVPVAFRWFREAGGRLSLSLRPLSGRYLSFAEREEIALLRVGGAGVPGIPRRPSRAPAAGSRGVRRHTAAPRGPRASPASDARGGCERAGARADRAAAGRVPP